MEIIHHSVTVTEQIWVKMLRKVPCSLSVTSQYILTVSESAVEGGEWRSRLIFILGL